MARGSIWALSLNITLFVGLSWLAILLELAPLRNVAGAWPAPDLLFCVAAFFALRRPRLTPVALILIIGIARDLITGAPAGLGALALLGAVGVLRALAPRLRRRGVVYQVLSVWLIAAAMIAAHALVLLLVLASAPAPDQLALRFGETAAAYVLVHIVLALGLRIAPDAVRDAQGLRRAE